VDLTPKTESRDAPARERAWRSIIGGFDVIFVSGRNVAGVTLFYGGAVALLGLSDLLLAHLIPAREYGSYQFVRSLAPLLVLASLLGLDQVLPRQFAGAVAHEKDWYALVPRLVGHGLALALAAGFVSVLLLGLPVVASTSLILSVPTIACSELAAAYLRCIGQYPKAALLQQGYRLVLGSIVLASLPWASYMRSLYPTGLAVASLSAGLVALGVLRKTKARRRISPLAIRRLVRTGILFAASTMTLGGLDWVDQATLALRFSSFHESGVYVALKVYLTFPFVTLVSILGFSALPEIAKNPARMTIKIFYGLQRRMIALAVTGALLLLFLFHIAPGVLPVEAETAYLPLFLGSGICRVLYLLPSSVIGALGSRAMLRRHTIWGIASIALEVAVILLLPARSFEPVVVGALGLLSGTATRLGSSWIFASDCLQRTREHSRDC
jgi:hypothetical protein